MNVCQEEDSHVVLPAGIVDDDTLLEPTAHIYYASRSSWEDKVTDLKRFDELPSVY